MSTNKSSSANKHPSGTSRKSTVGLPAKKVASIPAKAAKAAAAVDELRVSSRLLAGGFRVYGSPVQPRHRSIQEIADAVASLRRPA
jgi:hypothetical protein